MASLPNEASLNEMAGAEKGLQRTARQADDTPGLPEKAIKHRWDSPNNYC